MEVRVGESVALATFLPRKLAFLVPQLVSKRIHSTTASHVIAVVEGDPSCAQGP